MIDSMVKLNKDVKIWEANFASPIVIASEDSIGNKSQWISMHDNNVLIMYFILIFETCYDTEVFRGSFAINSMDCKIEKMVNTNFRYKYWDLKTFLKFLLISSHRLYCKSIFKNHLKRVLGFKYWFFKFPKNFNIDFLDIHKFLFIIEHSIHLIIAF